MKMIFIISIMLVFLSCNSINMHRETKIIQSKNFILNTNLPRVFSKSILQNCETDLMGYKTVYGIDIYPKNKINIFAILNENIQKTQLFVYPNTDPIEIHLELNDMVYLNRPSEGGANNIFGFAHELGHVVMMFDDSDFGQGFATYFGIHITDYIKTQLGEKAWPYSYDYVSNEGSGMIEKIKNKDNKSYSEKIVLGLEELDNMYGKKCIVDTITKLKDDDNSRLMFTYFNGKSISFKAYKKDDFIRELCQISGDQNIKTLFEK